MVASVLGQDDRTPLSKNNSSLRRLPHPSKATVLFEEDCIIKVRGYGRLRDRGGKKFRGEDPRGGPKGSRAVVRRTGPIPTS